MNQSAPQGAPTENGGQQQAAPQDNTTLMGILAYIGPLVLIPYLTAAKENSFVKFHTKQGLVLLVIEVILWVLSMMMIAIFLFPIIMIVNLGLIVLSILGILNVVNKKEAELPLVGSYAKHFTF